MCSCEPGWICVVCAGTRFDPTYFDDEDSGYLRREEENEGVSRVDWRDHEVAA